MDEIFTKRQEHIAKFFGDLAKAVFSVGLASYFFSSFPIAIRVGCVIAFFILMFVSFWLYPKK